MADFRHSFVIYYFTYPTCITNITVSNSVHTCVLEWTAGNTTTNTTNTTYSTSVFNSTSPTTSRSTTALPSTSSTTTDRDETTFKPSTTYQKVQQPIKIQQHPHLLTVQLLLQLQQTPLHPLSLLQYHSLPRQLGILLLQQS